MYNREFQLCVIFSVVMLEIWLCAFEIRETLVVLDILRIVHVCLSWFCYVQSWSLSGFDLRVK